MILACEQIKILTGEQIKILACEQIKILTCDFNLRTNKISIVSVANRGPVKGPSHFSSQNDNFNLRT